MKEAKVTQLKPRQVKVKNRQAKKNLKWLPADVRKLLKQIADKLPPCRYFVGEASLGEMKMVTGTELMEQRGGTGLNEEGLYPITSIGGGSWIEDNSKDHYRELRAAYVRGGDKEVLRVRDEIIKHYKDCREVHPEMYEHDEEE